MPRKKVAQPIEGHFGHRLAALRRRAGLSQLKLAAATGISGRMIAYYETREAIPPGHVLTALSAALGNSIDEMIGKKPESPRGLRVSRPLAQRVSLMEKLPLKDKRELFSIIDMYLAKNQLLDEQA